MILDILIALFLFFVVASTTVLRSCFDLPAIRKGQNAQ